MSMKKPLPPLFDAETELLFLEYEDLLFDMNEHGRELEELWEKFKAGNLPADLLDDAPLTLEMAICLPELQGVFTVSPDFRTRSESITVKTLRAAIDKGDLQCLRPNKNIFVTRRQISEWLEKCLDQKTISRPSSSERSAATSGARSRTKPSTSSTTTTSSTSLASARMILEQLKQPKPRSGNTSPKSTPKK
jgi:hypothetical protein